MFCVSSALEAKGVCALEAEGVCALEAEGVCALQKAFNCGLSCSQASFFYTLLFAIQLVTLRQPTVECFLQIGLLRFAPTMKYICSSVFILNSCLELMTFGGGLPL